MSEKFKYNYKAFYQVKMVSLLGQKLSIIVFFIDPAEVPTLEEIKLLALHHTLYCVHRHN